MSAETAAPTVAPAPRRPPDGPPQGRLAQVTGFHRDPLGFLRAGRDRFGDVFTVRFAIAGPMVVVADPAAAEPLFAADPGAAHTGEARRRILSMVSPDAVLGADGARHRMARGALAPLFAPEAIDRHRDAMSAIAGAHAERWPTGRPFQLVPRLRALADDIFVRLILGVADDGRARALAEATQRMLRVPGNPPLPPPGEGDGLAGALGERVAAHRMRPVADLLAAEAAERRREGPDPAVDAISALIAAGLSDEQIADQLIPLLMAGQEPPACALAWLLDRYSRVPDEVERLLADPDPQEIDRPFAREALRLRPAVHSSLRLLTEPRRVAGHELPAGTVAMLPIVLHHRDPRAFPEPDVFDPQRFATGPVASPPFLPFGDGLRRCLGEPLARAQVATVLPAVLARLRPRPLSAAPERMVVRGTVLVPRRGGLAVATPRPAGGGGPRRRRDGRLPLARAGTRPAVNASPDSGLAVVTGASTGIGLELAREFAGAGFDVVAVAEEDRIAVVERELSGQGVQVEAVQEDLSTHDGVERLWRRLREGPPIDAIALNVGIGASGAFTDTELDDHLRVVDVNVRSTVHLANHVARQMVERGEGRMLFTSSIAASMPGPFQSVYNASKSFVQSFALALREELRGTGVTVTTLMPGPTDTAFFDRADMRDTKIGAGPKDDAADVARAGFRALMAGDERAVAASAKTKLQGRGSRLLPDSIKARIHRRMSEPGSAGS